MIRFADAYPVSEFKLRTGMALHGMPGEQLLPFEGTAFTTTWTLELPKAANPAGLNRVTDARITADLRDATVYYTVFGEPEEKASTAAALESAKGVIRSEVGRQTGVRHTPTLTFVLDEVQEVIGRFSPLLHVLDHVGGRTDERLASFSVVVARDEAWHEATRLALESGADLERATRSLDRRAALIGDHLLFPGGPLGIALQLVAATESRDIGAVTDALLALG